MNMQKNGLPLAADICWHMERTKNISHFSLSEDVLGVLPVNLLTLSWGLKEKFTLKSCPVARAQ